MIMHGKGGGDLGTWRVCDYVVQVSSDQSAGEGGTPKARSAHAIFEQFLI